MALIINEFDGLTLYQPDGTPVNAMTLVPQSLDNGLSMGANIAVLAGQCVGFRLLSWVALLVAARYRYL